MKVCYLITFHLFLIDFIIKSQVILVYIETMSKEMIVKFSGIVIFCDFVFETPAIFDIELVLPNRFLQ